MDRQPPTAQAPPQGDPHPQRRPGPRPRPRPAPQGGTALTAARAFVQTVRHFFPDLNDWLQALPDTRDPDALVYETRFLAWWGLWLYLLQLGSRRQLDYALDDRDTCVLDNVNRLANTAQTTRPVHKTLDHYLGHVRTEAFHQVRLQMARRLLRMKALDAARLLGMPVLLADGTGLLCFHRPHCPSCLVQRHAKVTYYLHQVLEVKLLGPAGVVVSLESEFIENADAADARGRDAEQVKQDCELKALARLAPRLKRDFPQARFVLGGDSLLACGPVLALARTNAWSYVLTFKEGRLPTAWGEFQRLLPLCPQQVLERQQADGTRQVYRWVKGLSHQDSDGRWWRFDALECTETSPAGEAHYFAWITDLPVSARNVEVIAQKGGRYRWKIENEGFNRQKHSGLKLEHVYSTDPEKWKAYYYLLQIAFILTQLVERGSLLRRLAAEVGQTPQQMFGSLTNIVVRLREALLYRRWPDASYDAAAAASLHIGLDDTS